jgi:amidophosphoribosyltransferase
VIGLKSASASVALGLHALQHRGQEAVGITSFDGDEFFSRRGIGHVAQVFKNQDIFAELPGKMASGHVRYATTGGSGLRNIQPLFADLASGGFSIAHNGNISNAMTLKRDLVQKGSIFQSTSDTEVIIHLVATSRYPTLLDRFVDALRLVEGAYSLICMTPEGMIACRDPLGIRPLVIGRIGDGIIFASETVALDVIGAEFVREVEPGEMIQVSHDGKMVSQRPFGETPARPCIFEHVYFSRPDSVMGGQSVYEVRKAIGKELAKESLADADLVIPVPDRACPPPSAMRRKAASPSSWASSAATMSAAPSSSPATAPAMPM